MAAAFARLRHWLSAHRPARLSALCASLLLLALAAPAHAASRARYGGTLRLVVSGREPDADPSLADAPSEAAILALTSPGLCRLDLPLRPGDPPRIHPLLAQDLTRPSPQRLHIALRTAPSTPPPGAPASTVPTAAEWTAAWARLFASPTTSPYRALLFPLRENQLSALAAGANALELPVNLPWPDLERALCHPALAPRRTSPGTGAFVSTGARNLLKANLLFPDGRPFPDTLGLSFASDRAAARQLALHQAQVLIGAPGDAATAAPPALHATYLAFSPSKVGPEFRAIFESSVDRTDLTRYFVRAPAVAMSQLLPPALMPQTSAPRPAAPPALPRPRPVTLVYDASLEDQRQVAERIQVKLHDRGFRVALLAVSRAELRGRWAKGDFDLMLHALLLPPVTGPALALVLDAAGRHDLLTIELPQIGAIADPAARDARARERAEALRGTLSLLPLYAQGLQVQAAPQVIGLVHDAQGLPALDAAFLAE